MRVTTPNFTLVLAVAVLLIAEDAFAQNSDTLRETGRLLEQETEYWQETGCELPIFNHGGPQRIYLIPPNLTGFGFELGDYLLKVDGIDAPRNNSDFARFLSKIPADSVVEVLVDRNGKAITLVTECRAASENTKMMRRLVAALKKGDGSNCLSEIQKIIIRYGGALPVSLEMLRQTCLMVANPKAYQTNYVLNAYNFARMMIEQTKYFPEQFNMYRGNILAQIENLEQVGRPLFAAELEHMYVAALEFMENDKSQPAITSAKATFTGSCFFVTPDGAAIRFGES